MSEDAPGAQASRPVAYARISQDRYGAGINARTQGKDMRALAARLGLPEPDLLIDNDLSAYNRRKPRPGYKELCEGLRAGWDGLLIWHADRLHRHVGELVGFMEIHRDTGFAIWQVNGAQLDLGTAQGRATAVTLGAWAQAESEQKAERLKSKAAYTLGRGKNMGGPRYFGWEADHVTMRPDEAAVVIELTDRVIAGDTLSAIARDMQPKYGSPRMRLEWQETKRDRLSRDIAAESDEDAREALREELAKTEARIAGFDGKWTATLVRHLVLRPRNCGLQVLLPKDRHGKIIGREVTEIVGEWAPILPRARWEIAEAILRDPGRRKNDGRQDKLMLTGVMTCGKCGHYLQSTGARTPGVGRLGCRSCFGVSCATELCDELIHRVMETVLDANKVKAAQPGSRPAAPHDDAEEELLARRATLGRLFAAGTIDETELAAGAAEIRTQITAIRRERGTPQKPSPSRGVTGKIWRDLPRERQRAILRELAEITLLPRPGAFHPERVRIVPRNKDTGAVFADAIAKAAREVAALNSTRRAVTRSPQPRHEISCAVCGKTVMTGNSRGRYCSPRCSHRATTIGLAPVTVLERKHELVCEICATTFKSAYSTARFCSQSCRYKNHERRKAAGKSRQEPKIYTRRCRMCLETFQAAKADALYCSKECRSAAVRDRQRKGQSTQQYGGIKAIHLQACDVCGRQYMSAKQDGPFYCTPTCRSTAYYRAHRTEVLAKRKTAWASKRKGKRGRATAR